MVSSLFLPGAHDPRRKCKNRYGNRWGIWLPDEEDFLVKYQGMRAVMVDISPFLLDYQRRVLHPFQAEFINRDFLELDSSVLAGIDLALMNENLGDFPVIFNTSITVTDAGQEGQDACVKKSRRLRRNYELRIPEGESSAFNFGAALAVEKLCLAGIPFIFLSEHSCEARVLKNSPASSGCQPPASPNGSASRGMTNIR